MTPAEFQARFRGMVSAVTAAKPKMLQTAARELAATIRGASPSSVRNVKGNKELLVVAETLGEQAVVRGVGPWALVERSIRGHDINPRNARALNIGGNPRAHARHPGVQRTNGPFARGVEAGAPVIAETCNTELVSVMHVYL